MRKLKNFVSNTSSHQQEIVDNKSRRTSSHQKVDSVNSKIVMVMQNKYYNSPSSLMASTQQTQAPNTRLHSGYRRANASTHSEGKHGSNSQKPPSELSRIQNLKAEPIIKNSKGSVDMKTRKSENFSKLKHRDIHHEVQLKSGCKSHYISGKGSNMVSMKNSQNLFAYPVSSALVKHVSEIDEHLISTGKSTLS